MTKAGIISKESSIACTPIDGDILPENGEGLCKSIIERTGISWPKLITRSKSVV